MQIAIISVPTLSNKENITNGSLVSALILKAFKKATFIPNNATNGDVIKAMFPNTSIHYHKADELVDDYVSVNIMGCDTQQDYSADWWNTPYRAESEDKEV